MVVETWGGRGGIYQRRNCEKTKGRTDGRDLEHLISDVWGGDVESGNNEDSSWVCLLCNWGGRWGGGTEPTVDFC